jgi:hypothetical protein
VNIRRSRRLRPLFLRNCFGSITSEVMVAATSGR